MIEKLKIFDFNIIKHEVPVHFYSSLLKEDIDNVFFEREVLCNEEVIEEKIGQGYSTVSLRRFTDGDYVLKLANIKPLIDYINKFVLENYYGTQDSEAQIIYNRVWMNKVHKNSCGKCHTHNYDDPSGGTAIFYFNVPQNGSKLVILKEDIGDEKITKEHKNIAHYIEVKTGDLIIHTANTPHAVSEHMSDEPRICFIFDFTRRIKANNSTALSQRAHSIRQTKKIAVIGKGTAGSQAVAHFLRQLPNYEIEWYFDDAIPTQSVGEGSTLSLSESLFDNLNFNYIDLDKIDSTLKLGIYKSGWGKTNNPFLHSLFPPNAALHFNAKALQEYIFDRVKDKVSIINTNVKASDIDADYIMDCSGKPSQYELFHESSYIPVNAAYITQCPWGYPRFQHTLTIARPYGWVFGIPLKNRCSIGYLFNKSINNVEEVKKDVKNVFAEHNLNPSETSTYLEFNNYYRKKNYTERVVYNGNASFFLEPLEATSISTMHMIQKDTLWLLNDKSRIEEANSLYLREIREIETMIMLHYFAGSIYETKFWEFAQERGTLAIQNALKKDSKFASFITEAIKRKQANLAVDTDLDYGTWTVASFCLNLSGLGISNLLSHATVK